MNIRDIPKDEHIHKDEAITYLILLCENFRMKYGNRNVVYLEMAIDALQRQKEEDGLFYGVEYD